MTKITNVTKARKAPGRCGRCGVELGVGDAYRHASPGFRGRKLVRCMKTSCDFRQSELTTSKLAGLYEANETLEDELAGLGIEDDDETLSGYLETCAESCEQVAEEYREASQEWAGGNGNEEWDERADEISSYADEIRDAEFTPLADAKDHDDWVETVQGEISEVLMGCPL